MTAVTFFSEEYIAINALFIQPTGFCARNCDGCYVKKSTSTLTPGLVEDLVSGNYIDYNQVTFAVDTLPKSDDWRFGHMIVLLESFLGGIQSKPDNSETHITVHTFNDLYTYIMSSDLVRETIEYLNLVTFSVPPTALDILWFKSQYPKVKININIMYEGQIKALERIIKYVDHVYVLLKKDGFNIHSLKDVKNYWKLLNLVNAIAGVYSYKVTGDGCIHDAEMYKKNLGSCSSNLSRFHIWPDGRVTGCPYNHKFINTKNQTALDIGLSLLGQRKVVINNIIKASQVYEFDRCLIPTSFFGPVRKFLRVL